MVELVARESCRYPWKTFAFLVGAGTVTNPLVIPYLLGLVAIAPEPHPPVPLSSLMLFGFIQTLMFLLPAAGIGLFVARKIGLGARISKAGSMVRRGTALRWHGVQQRACA